MAIFRRVSCVHRKEQMSYRGKTRLNLMPSLDYKQSIEAALKRNSTVRVRNAQKEKEEKVNSEYVI